MATDDLRFCPWCGVRFTDEERSRAGVRMGAHAADRTHHDPRCPVGTKDYANLSPVFCTWCGAELAGGATPHAPDCFIRSLTGDLRRARRECACRSCGHPASVHIAGDCYACGREACWS